ncbi:hypothetical protein PV326_011402 [Microctonus aethiopoides]|nr:hypothetical protein PV326_011402 [Microctonus aethiopoides]
MERRPTGFNLKNNIENPKNTTTAANNKRRRENSTINITVPNKKSNTLPSKPNEKNKLSEKEIIKLQKELGIKPTQRYKTAPNLNVARAKTQPPIDIKDFTATINPDSPNVDNNTIEIQTPEHPDEPENWETPKSPIKLSLTSTNTVSTVINNQFAPLTEVNEEINTDISPQPKKTILPVYALAENCSIKALAKILRDDPKINGKFRLNHPTASKYITITLNDVSTFSNTKELLDTNNIPYFSYTPKHLRPKSLVLKGIRGDYSIDEIKDEIAAQKKESMSKAWSRKHKL